VVKAKSVAGVRLDCLIKPCNKTMSPPITLNKTRAIRVSSLMRTSQRSFGHLAHQRHAERPAKLHGFDVLAYGLTFSCWQAFEPVSYGLLACFRLIKTHSKNGIEHTEIVSKMVRICKCPALILPRCDQYHGVEPFNTVNYCRFTHKPQRPKTSRNVPKNASAF
jgi:hypothetical protein